MCYICDTYDKEQIVMIETMMAEGRSPRDIISFTRENSLPKVTSVQLAFHKRHAEIKAAPKESFYLRAGRLYNAVTNEVIEFIDPKVALKVIVTIGTMQIMATGGERLSPRYVSEAAQALLESIEEDTTDAELNKAWHGALIEKPVQVNIVEANKGDMNAYRKQQDETRRQFMKDIGKAPVEVDDDAGSDS